MPEHKVIQPLRHDGERYAIGATVDMPAPQAKPLVLAGVLDGAAAGGKVSADTLIAQIGEAADVAALKQLAADDKRKSVVAAYSARLAELGGE